MGRMAFRVTHYLYLFFIPLFMAHTAQAQEAHSLLWKISGNNQATPSYLLGTMHMICGEDFEIKPKIKQALKQVKTVTFEADIANMEGSEKLMDLMKPVPGILDHIKREQLTALDSLLKENQLTLDALNYMSPFGLTSMLTVKAFNCTDPANIKMMEKKSITWQKTIRWQWITWNP